MLDFILYYHYGNMSFSTFCLASTTAGTATTITTEQKTYGTNPTPGNLF